VLGVAHGDGSSSRLKWDGMARSPSADTPAVSLQLLNTLDNAWQLSIDHEAAPSDRLLDTEGRPRGGHPFRGLAVSSHRMAGAEA
jgi:hypothetical protein